MAVKLDQHFLIDKAILEKISSYANKEDVILEIGAGHGELTNYLLKRAKFVYANEIKKELFKFKAGNCRAIFGNVLKIKFPKANKIFGNIPYSLSEPLIERLFEEQFDSAYLLVSKSFFDILCGKRASRFSAVCPLFFSAEKLLYVKRECFEPKPRTESILVMLRLRQKEGLRKWERVAKEVWIQKDKLAKNALAVALCRISKLTKRNTKVLLCKYSLPKKRVYMLDSKEFLKIVKIIKNMFGE